MRRGRSRSRHSDYGRWPEYVPVAQRRETAQRETEKLRKLGSNLQPVEIEGRTIAKSFWGKGWCTHLESMGDYSNRLPRGRTYVRNGSVCHLGITKGNVDAIVSGSSLYRVAVHIAPLKQEKWDLLKQRCTGRIGSLIELLQGKLSAEIMNTVTDRNDGLFPLPGEIKYACNCPDSASMCKHISAVMYGIGARLDAQPELLFLLRGVDHQDLITADAATGAMTGTGSRRAGRRMLAGKNLENVFGVELDNAAEAVAADSPMPQTKMPKPKIKTPAKKAGEKSSTSKIKKPAPFKPTASSIAGLRQRLGMSKAAFARDIGVSVATITHWEAATGTITPQAKGLAGLKRLHDPIA